MVKKKKAVLQKNNNHGFFIDQLADALLSLEVDLTARYSPDLLLTVHNPAFLVYPYPLVFCFHEDLHLRPVLAPQTPLAPYAEMPLAIDLRLKVVAAATDASVRESRIVCI